MPEVLPIEDVRPLSEIRANAAIIHEEVFMNIAGKYLTSVHSTLLTLLILFICCSSTFAAPLSNDEAIEIVQNSIKWHLSNVPIGKIGILTAMQSASYQQGKVYLGQKEDLRKYTYAYNKELDAWVKIGVIQLEEFYNSSSRGLRSAELRHDGNKYLVSLTKEGQEMIDTLKNNSEKEMFPMLTGQYFVINLAKSKVTSIVKNIEVKGQGKYGTKDIRLVMGTHEYFPTELGVKYFDLVGGVKDKERKFRTIMEYDPFKNKYKIIAFDAGIISTGKWLTNRVEE